MSREVAHCSGSCVEGDSTTWTCKLKDRLCVRGSERAERGNIVVEHDVPKHDVSNPERKPARLNTPGRVGLNAETVKFESHAAKG